MLTPFLIINIMINGKFTRTTVLLETIGSFSGFLYDAAKSYIFADYKLMSRLLVRNFIPDASIYKYGNLYNMLQRLGISQYGILFSTISITTLIIILILSRPSKSDQEIKESEKKIPQSLLFSRIALIAFSTGLIIYAYTATTNPISYTNLYLDSQESEINLVGNTQEYTVSQTIKFQDERELKELTLKFKNDFYARSNFSLLDIEIWDVSNDTCIFKKYIGSSSIKDDEFIRIDLEASKVNSSDDYEIRLTGIAGVKYYQGRDNLSVYLTKTVDESIGKVKVNGEEKPNSLYLQIR